MSKRPIPPVPAGQTPGQERFDRSVKETIEIITGARGKRIKPLAADAGIDDLIAKMNEVLETFQ